MKTFTGIGFLQRKNDSWYFYWLLYEREISFYYFFNILLIKIGASTAVLFLFFFFQIHVVIIEIVFSPSVSPVAILLTTSHFLFVHFVEKSLVFRFLNLFIWSLTSFSLFVCFFYCRFSIVFNFHHHSKVNFSIKECNTFYTLYTTLHKSIYFFFTFFSFDCTPFLSILYRFETLIAFASPLPSVISHPYT